MDDPPETTNRRLHFCKPQVYIVLFSIVCRGKKRKGCRGFCKMIDFSMNSYYNLLH